MSGIVKIVIFKWIAYATLPSKTAVFQSKASLFMISADIGCKTQWIFHGISSGFNSLEHFFGVTLRLELLLSTPFQTPVSLLLKKGGFARPTAQSDPVWQGKISHLMGENKERDRCLYTGSTLSKGLSSRSL
ncbi:hypothetical protein CIHG_05237 [Coccidioides immitis H538.4]|uniref:Uncharacterized protein n=1 Tax=Coccidioides immitis H538.4 TaxID=396776 RepID=A0A0J8RRM2_COCIT|nr:hypothetical protein CIHG_05237 [Coccidioides immitis H538.4]